MNSAYKKISTALPLNAQTYSLLTEDEVEHIDQYLFRLSKLQDTIGKRLFRIIFVILEEDTEELAFIDLLNRLEKLNILESSEQWLELRKITNTLAHTYDDDPEEMSIAINAVLNNKQILEQIYQRLIAYSARINK